MPLDPKSVFDCCHLATVHGDPVPLEGVDVRAEVFGAQARVVLRQRYKNAEKQPIEAIYTFPVPSEAALVGFAMESAGGRATAEVREREEAFARYDDAIAAGHGAALLDEERRNVFTASVGNLLPGEETIVEVAYVQALRADEGALRFVVPTVVAPRYVPGAPKGDRTAHGTTAPTSAVPDADRISPVVARVDYGFTLDVLFDLGRHVDVESPSHKVVCEDAGGGRTRVRLRRSEAPLDRDLVLVASGLEGESAGAVCDRSGGDGTVALSVVPDLFDGKRAARRDVVFVVDVSGSMQGTSIDQARSALRLCLRQLAEGDRFDVIAFSTTSSAMFGGVQGFTQRRLEQADRWVAALQADGGTEMAEPLVAAVAALGDASRDRVVVLLTDGQVGNEQQIIDAVLARAEGVRFYTFGIGLAVSDLLVNDLARRTRGAAEFIYPGEGIDEKVTAQFARAIARRVKDVTLTFEGVDVAEMTPGELPDLVDGEPWVVYGRYASGGRGRAVLRGKRDGEAFCLELKIELAGEAKRAGLAQLWARGRIRDLEEAKLDGRRAEANRKRILALSIEHQVASKLASFVVVEKRTGARLAHKLPEARPVPVSAPGSAVPMRSMLAGFGPGSAPGGSAYGAPPPMGMGSPPPAVRMGSPPAMRMGSPPPQGMPMARLDVAMRDTGAPPPPPPPPRAAAPAPARPSILERARALLAKGAGGAPEALAGPPAEESAKGGARAPSSPSELFSTQLASGLWGPADGGDAERLMPTARALAAAFAMGIDAQHPMYGAQIKKGIEAVLAAASALAGDAAAERALTAALLAAHLVATGNRHRARILGLATGPLAGMSRHLQSPETAKKRLAELAVQ